MMRSKMLGLCGMLVACFVAVLPVQAAPQRDWAEYRNPRYGFQLQYPADLFVLERTTKAGDGQAFRSREGGARLLVGTLPNSSGFSPSSYQQYLERHSYARYNVQYRKSGQTWLVLSGMGAGQIFYEKVFFSCAGRVITSFAMLYPADRRHLFNPVVERMEDSFRPGDSCETPG